MTLEIANILKIFTSSDENYFKQLSYICHFDIQLLYQLNKKKTNSTGLYLKQMFVKDDEI